LLLRLDVLCILGHLRLLAMLLLLLLLFPGVSLSLLLLLSRLLLSPGRSRRIGSGGG